MIYNNVTISVRYLTSARRSDDRKRTSIAVLSKRVQQQQQQIFSTRETTSSRRIFYNIGSQPPGITAQCINTRFSGYDEAVNTRNKITMRTNTNIIRTSGGVYT